MGHRTSESRRRYYELDPDKLLKTITDLSKRVGERFPDSGISGVARELVEIGKLGRERMEWIGRPIWLVRWLTYFVVAMLVLGLALIVFRLKPDEGVFEFATFVSVLEAGLNDLVMLGVVIFFPGDAGDADQTQACPGGDSRVAIDRACDRHASADEGSRPGFA